MTTSTKAEAYIAIRNWCEARGGVAKNFKLDTSAPMTTGNVAHDLETSICLWRARCVEEAIGKLGPSPFFRALLSDLLWHHYGDSRDLEGFRGIPRGRDGASMLRAQLATLIETIAAILEAGGRPTLLEMEQAGFIHVPKVAPESATKQPA